MLGCYILLKLKSGDGKACPLWVPFYLPHNFLQFASLLIKPLEEKLGFVDFNPLIRDGLMQRICHLSGENTTSEEGRLIQEKM
jgi:hypothetical protein